MHTIQAHMCSELRMLSQVQNMEHNKRHEWNDPYNCPLRICWDVEKKKKMLTLNLMSVSFHIFNNFFISFFNRITVDHLTHNSQWQRIIITLWTTLKKTECVKCTQIDPFSSPVAPVSLAKYSSRNFWGKFILWLRGTSTVLFDKMWICLLFQNVPRNWEAVFVGAYEKGKETRGSFTWHIW